MDKLKVSDAARIILGIGKCDKCRNEHLPTNVYLKDRTAIYRHKKCEVVYAAQF